MTSSSSITCRFLPFFFFNDTATTEIYTLSLHDALPISPRRAAARAHRRHLQQPDRGDARQDRVLPLYLARRRGDRKSTRLNSSHLVISYAVFCLKKKRNPRHNKLDIPATSAQSYMSII